RQQWEDERRQNREAAEQTQATLDQLRAELEQAREQLAAAHRGLEERQGQLQTAEQDRLLAELEQTRQRFDEEWQGQAALIQQLRQEAEALREQLADDEQATAVSQAPHHTRLLELASQSVQEQAEREAASPDAPDLPDRIQALERECEEAKKQVALTND